MPKIGKDNFRIKGQYVEVEIWYTQKTGFYYKKLPEEVSDLTEFGHRRYTNEGEMKTHLLCCLTDYHNKIASKRKVIAYHLYGSAEMVMKRMEGEYNGYCGIKPGVSPHFDHPSGGVDYMFGFDFHVLFEVTAQKTEYFRIMADGTPGGHFRKSPDRFCIIIDWTAEREQFFNDLKDKLQQLIYGVSAFFDQPNLLELMDTYGIKMLDSAPKPIETEPKTVEVSTVVPVEEVQAEIQISEKIPQTELRSTRKSALVEGAEKMTVAVFNNENSDSEALKEKCAWLKNISLYGVELFLKEAERRGYVDCHEKEEELRYVTTQKGKRFVREYLQKEDRLSSKE